MKIYDYQKFSHVYLGGSALNKEESLIPAISSRLAAPGSIEPHPKEIERMERLKKRKKGMRLSNMRRGDGSFNDSVIILSGSTGFGSKSFEHFDEILKELNQLLKNNNTHLVFIRGNNDDPSYFTDGKIDYSNIKAVEDYSLLKFNGFNCLCIGGGISLDRKWKKTQGERLKKNLYWNDEPTQFRPEELKEILADNEIACVITHVPPSFMGAETSSYSKSKWSENDKEVITDAINERVVIDKIYTEFVKANKKPYVWMFTNDGGNNSLHLNNIRFMSSDSINNIISLNETVENAFGFRLGSHDVSNYFKKPSKSFEERLQMYNRNLAEDFNLPQEEQLDGDAEMEVEEGLPDNGDLYEMEMPQDLNLARNPQQIRYEPLRADRMFIQRPPADRYLNADAINNLLDEFGNNEVLHAPNDDGEGHG